MNQRFDVGTLKNVQKTPQGGFRVDAALTRTGIFKYTQHDGSVVNELRPGEEVFAAESLATLPDAPVTVGHPGDSVSPDNHNEHAQGHVRDVRKDGELLAANVVIQGRRAIQAIEGGIREVSCGYTCRIDETPGVLPSGERYDRVQRGIRYNHVALVDEGRAGPQVRLRLDSDGNQNATKENTMKVERIDGVEYEIGTPAHAHAVKQHDEKLAARASELAKQSAELTKQTARADAAEADKAKIATQVAELSNPARLDAAVTARATLLEQARGILGAECKLDGKSEGEIKAEIVAKVYPTLKLDASDAVRTATLFEAAILSADKRIDAATSSVLAALVPAASVPGAPVKPTDIADRARLDMLERSRNEWRQPLATSVAK